MLEQTLKKAIPSQLSSFNKLTDGYDPYYFASWEKEEGISILRYWFWDKTKTRKNKKRVFINEIEELLKHSLPGNIITRDDFRKFCPRTLSDGPCGFAITIRILEYFQVVKVANGEYEVKSVEKIHELLSNQ
jgi:hypothetical protein